MPANHELTLTRLIRAGLARLPVWAGLIGAGPSRLPVRGAAGPVPCGFVGRGSQVGVH